MSKVRTRTQGRNKGARYPVLRRNPQTGRRIQTTGDQHWLVGLKNACGAVIEDGEAYEEVAVMLGQSGFKRRRLTLEEVLIYKDETADYYAGGPHATRDEIRESIERYEFNAWYNPRTGTIFVLIVDS